jgi:Fe-S oxidoreductase
MALEDYRNDMMRCVRCSTCKFIPLNSLPKSWRFAYGCPSIKKYNFHPYSGGGKMITALSLIDDRIDYSDKLLDIAYKCTLCGLCDTSCKTGMDLELLEVFFELRQRLVKEGYGPLPGHKPILDSVKNYDNVWMQPRSRRDVWSKKIKVKDLNKEKADVLYYAGCTYSLDSKLQQVARNTVELLQEGGVDVGVLGRNEKCCASPIFMVGDHDLFEKYARENIEMFNDLGVEKVVTSCAGCYGLMKTHYPRLGIKMNFELVHSIELISEMVEQGKFELKNDVPMKVTYHDPCHLGRLSEPREPSHGVEERKLGILPVKSIDKVMGFNGVFDPPRVVLDAIPGLHFSEMERIREYSWCCGAGGGVKSAFPDFALDTAKERVEEAISTGAEALRSCCPWCERNLEDANVDMGNPLQVLDATDLLIKSIK